MKKLLLLFLLFVISVFSMFADLGFSKIDELIFNKAYADAKFLLKESNGLSRVGINIRLAGILVAEVTEHFEWEDDSDDEKERLLTAYGKALDYIDEAFEFKNALNDPETYKLYYYRALLKSLRGGVKRSLSFLKEIKYVFNDMNYALTLRPDFLDAISFLGGMYQFLPGWPISWGSKVKAISFSRYALRIMNSADLKEKEYSRRSVENNLNLAVLLEDRSWSAKKRAKKQKSFAEDFEEAEDRVEEIGFYEGTISIPYMSDEEEAVKLLKKVEILILKESSYTGEEKAALKERIDKLKKKLD